MALGIDQGPARIAWIDGRIGLDKVFIGVDAKPGAAKGTDDALGHGLAHTKRITNGQDGVANPGICRPAKGNHG